jgi:hypothetical protein
MQIMPELTYPPDKYDPIPMKQSTGDVFEAPGYIPDLKLSKSTR